MIRRTATLTALVTLTGVTAAHGWVGFEDQTSLRMPTGPDLNDPSTSTADVEEKDYAWGDVDQDGDIDLVCVRKQPFTSTGKRVNILFMNEGTAEGHAVDGVLVDRTDVYATASDVPGDNGFATATNDRDVALVDVDNDGWLDMVTAPTLTDNQAKNLSHPRVYMNLGEIDGVWQGFEYQDARIPQMHPNAGPRFCSVAAGDVTGDGFVDLYFGDYDSGGSQIFDYNNKLLINDGTGHFIDESNLRLTSEMRLSAFGAASVIADMNNDGVNDVVKQTSLNAPQHVAVTYNDPTDEGMFSDYQIVNQAAPYFVSVGELNNDGKLDMVIVDDGTDQVLFAGSIGGGGVVSYNTKLLPSDASAGFGGNSWIEDLNNDGWNDIIVTDVDVDIPGCSRTTAIYRNMGNAPNNDFQVQGEVIPFDRLDGVHDVAVFDLNGDGWKDIVIGRCDETAVWINQPPIGIVFSYPEGLPTYIEPNVDKEILVSLDAFGGGDFDPSTVVMHYAIGDGDFVTTSMSPVSKNTFSGVVPGVDCATRIRVFFEADLDSGGTFADPANAPELTYSLTAATGTQVVFRDEMEGDVSGWTVTSENLSTGAWEVADPNGTIVSGNLASPEDDATAGAENVKAWITQNGPVGGAPGVADLDGGPTVLTSPIYNLFGIDATISFARWMFSDDADDEFQVQISGDVDNVFWTTIDALTTSSTDSAWETVSFVVGDYINPSPYVRIRFIVADQPNNSVTEAGLDNFQVETIACGPACPADLDDSGTVGFDDLVQLLSAWGSCPDCPEDLDGSGMVDFGDLVEVLAAWGPCE